MAPLVPSDAFEAARNAMVATQLRARGVRDERVLTAMASVPRHEFVPVSQREHAYEDNPTPIGEGQTISQPYIVALMLQALRLSHDSRVLEVGTGSGYQTALLAELSQHVYSIERHASLAEAARSVLVQLGYAGIAIAIGDGSLGWPDHAPFDAIIVSAAAPELPSALFDQLREGGRMIVPVGQSSSQQLHLVQKIGGKAALEVRESCRFVPLIAG